MEKHLLYIPLLFSLSLTAQDTLLPILSKNIFTGKEEPPTSFSSKFSVKDIIIQSVDNKSISVSVRGEAKNVSFPLSLPFKALETNNEDRNPLAAKPEAGVPITDAEGRIYEVNDAGKTMQIGQQGKDITPQEYSQETRKMTYALKNSNKKIFFKAYEKEPLAFDAWQQVFAGKKIIEDEYENIGEAYRVPQKLIPVGMTGKVRVDLNGLHKDSVIFKTPAGSVYLLQEDNILSIASGKDQDGIEIFARNKNDSTQVYGKLKVVSYKPKELKVHLVPVDVETQINKDALEKELNKIYYAYGINISVIVENNITDKSWDINNDGKLDVGETGILNFRTEEMKNIHRLNTTANTNDIYLYLVQTPSKANIGGDIPLGSQYGFLFGNPDAKTIAHEIGHGYFQLKHTFDESINLSKTQTDNLMDYSNNNHKLYKFQWDLMHNKGLLISKLWQSDSAGEKSRRNFSEAIYRLRECYQIKGDNFQLNELDFQSNIKFSGTIMLPLSKSNLLPGERKTEKKIDDIAFINYLDNTKLLNLSCKHLNFEVKQLIYNKDKAGEFRGSRVEYTAIEEFKKYNDNQKAVSVLNGYDGDKKIFGIVSVSDNSNNDINDIMRYLNNEDTTKYKGNDKGVIIFCNGEVMDMRLLQGTLNPLPSSVNTIQRGSEKYWNSKLIDLIKKETGDKNDIIFRNGDNGGLENSIDRYNIGVEEGKRDAAYIKSKLGNQGSVKLISHSKGCAYAVGYIKGLLEADKNIHIEWNLMLAPHQGKKWNFIIEGNQTNIGIRHFFDFLSSKISTNASLNLLIKNYQMLETYFMTEEKIYKEIKEAGKEIGKKVGEKVGEKMFDNIKKSIEKQENEGVKKINRKLTKQEAKDIQVQKIVDSIMQTEGVNKLLDGAIDVFEGHVGLAHSIDGFHFEIEAFLKVFYGKANDYEKSIRNAKKQTWDAGKNKYVEP